MANGTSQMAERQKLIGKRVIVYSGPHYGHVHHVESVSESLAFVYYRGDRFGVPFCDLELVEEVAA